MGSFMGFRELRCRCGSVIGLEDSVFDIDGNERATLSWQEWEQLQGSVDETQVVIKESQPVHIPKANSEPPGLPVGKKRRLQ